MVHGRKRSEWTKTVRHKVGGKFQCKKTGPQSADGWWSTGKKATFGVGACRPLAIDMRVREKQWHHWIGDKDRWVESGKVIGWVP